ncbi:unnamed protein product [Mesocestoides corti]|uniref:Protein kinase domain-containing protein n=1 Tax=Mesocestoides corti TaxID=53468 RepID=A0A0R3UJZ4_MESCO|nr:unnamed protein product [Mesocestoides corti]
MVFDVILDTSYHEIPHDHIAYRYECIQSLGKGSFGNVILAIDHKTGTKCAIKVVRRDIRFTTQAKIEISILELLQKANPFPAGASERFPIVRLIEHFMFREHMCLSFELLGCSLYDLIKDKKDQGLPRDRVRRLMASVLEGLTYIWNAGIIHCDLKPENVLLVSQSADGGPDEIRDFVKIIDFGSSCFIGKQCYPYIQSRFYRAPEVIMRLEYGQPIDVWSFGCLVFEMIRGYPLFPGEDEFDQLACMMEKLGLPPRQMIMPSRVFSRYFYESDGSRRYYTTVDKQTVITIIPHYCTTYQNMDGSIELRQNLSKKTRRLRKPPGAVPVAQALVSTLSHSSGKHNDYTPTRSEEVDNVHVVKLIEACLRWIPGERISPDQAKAFSWFSYKTSNAANKSLSSLLTKSSNNLNLLTESEKRSRVAGPAPHVAESLKPRNIPSPLPNIVPAAPMPVVAATAPVTVDNTHPNVTTTIILPPSQVLSSSKKKISVTSISPPASVNIRRQGSSASISSGENKQEERVIYARGYKPPSHKTSVVEYANHNRDHMEKKISDISLTSLCSSIEDSAPWQTESSRYARRLGVQIGDRYQDSSARLRKRNQSVEPKRHTQPVGTEVLVKEHNAVPNKSLITCKTATMSPSPDDRFQSNGRHNPHVLAKTSQLDLTLEDPRHGKQSSPEECSSISASKTRQPISAKSEMLAVDGRMGLPKVRSMGEFRNSASSSVSRNTSDESEESIKKPISEMVPRSARQKTQVFKEVIYEPSLSSSEPRLIPQQSREFQFTKQPFTRNPVPREVTARRKQPHTDHRRRRLPSKATSASHLNDLSNASNSREVVSSPRVHNGRLNSTLQSILMVKPQT